MSNNFMDPLYDCVFWKRHRKRSANAQLAATTMVGRDGVTAHALDPERLLDVLREYDSVGTAR